MAPLCAPCSWRRYQNGKQLLFSLNINPCRREIVFMGGEGRKNTSSKHLASTPCGSHLWVAVLIPIPRWGSWGTEARGRFVQGRGGSGAEWGREKSTFCRCIVVALPLETSMRCRGNQQALAEAPATLSPLQLVSEFKQTFQSPWVWFSDGTL